MVISLFNSNFKAMKFLNHLVDDMSLPLFFLKKISYYENLI